MGSRYSRLALALGALVALASASCMQQRPAINRVQPDYVDKMDFIPVEYQALTASTQTPEQLSPQLLAREPVFYTQTTLIAKPTASGFTGLTSYNESDKIRWEVTENYLVARQAWEYMRNAPQGPDGIGQIQQFGDVVAVFAIESHFDIRREYNTTTGEELNVIEENSIDRPWYQRRYMRVDWSRNLISGYNTVLAEAEWQGVLQSEPVPTYINNPDDPNYPVFHYDQVHGQRTLTYFDFVNRAVLHPETATLSYVENHPNGIPTTFNNFPACYLQEPYDCAPSEVTFRVAFRRVDQDRDYEPMPVSTPDPSDPHPYQNLDMERFGFFDQARLGYDRDHHAGLDTNRVHWASRHNLWVWHHALWNTNDHGMDTATLCNTDSECAEGQACHIGNQAHDATHRGVCANLVIHHLPQTPVVAGGIAGQDVSCQSDDDCRQTYNGLGVSRSAICDTSTHTCGEHYTRCQIDDDCHTLVDPMSHCDLASATLRADNRGLCTMPYRQRIVRPVVYHESNGYPGYMQPVTTQIAHEWNDAFHTAVIAARRHECQLEHNIDPSDPSSDTEPVCNSPLVTGYDPAASVDAQGHAVLDPNAAHDAQYPFVACHSPVWGEDMTQPGGHTHDEVVAAHNAGWDLPSCGHQGDIARIGDMRYSMMGAITDHDQQGYWGLANIASDPETGEMVVGRGAVWQTITDYYATWLVDLVRLFNGELDVNSISSGAYLYDSIRQLGGGMTTGQQRLAAQMPGGNQSQTVSSQILDAPFRRGDQPLSTMLSVHNGLDHFRAPNAGWLTPDSGITLFGDHRHNIPGAFDRFDQMTVASAGGPLAGVLGDGTPSGAFRMQSLASTGLEASLMNEEQARLAPTATPDDTAALPETLTFASPFRGQNPAMMALRQRVEQLRSSWECAMEEPFSDDLLLGLANRLLHGPAISCSNPDDASVCFGRDWNFQNSDGSMNYDLMTQYAAQFIHHGVLAHEIGHSLGQRHNFTASADAINYNDNYWRVRMAPGHHLGLASRAQYLADPMDGNYYSQAEIDGRVDEWSYSSVMDYKGLNEDAHGIGRYDYAFIANGYVGMTQAFRQVSNMDLALQYSFNTAGAGLSTPLDLSGFGRGQINHMHYTQIPSIFGMTADGRVNIGDDNRYWVFTQPETAIQALNGWGAPSFSNVTNDGHLLVPYRFDTDERAGLIWQDQRYDAGPDIFESLHYVQERWLDYYFSNSFARFRIGFSPEKYVSRMWGRSLGQTRQTAQIAMFDLINFQQFFATLPSWQAFLNDPLGGGLNNIAMQMTADSMINQITMPEIGVHNSQPQPDGTTLDAPNLTTNAGVNIPVNIGRAVTSTWNNNAGFWWYEQFQRAGSYYDKVMSLEAFADPDLYLLNRTSSGDVRQYEVGFFQMFPEQTLRFFGGLMSEDNQDFAPIINTASTPTNIDIQRPHLATINLPMGTGAGQNGRHFDSTHVPLDPQDHFTIQLWAAAATMAMIPTSFDQTYMNYTRMWLDGSVDAITVQNQDVNTVTFTDPWTHQTYRALHIGAGAGEPGAQVGASALVHPATGAVANEAGIAARMILHAQDLEFRRQQAIAAGQMTQASAIELAERNYLNIMDGVRYLSHQFGTGSIWIPPQNSI